MKEAIVVKDLLFKTNEKTILSIPSLSIEKGKVTGVIGPNGAGKSSLLKMVTLLEKPSKGSIRINDNQIWPGNFSLHDRRDLAVVFQQPLMLNTSVFKNVAIGLKYRKLPKKEIIKRVTYWLGQFHISHLAEVNAKKLSGGEAQRVGLARAFVTNPKLLFLDEPFSALDLPTRKKLLKDFKRILHEANTTTFFISHDYQEIEYLCNNVIIMLDGTVSATCSIDILSSNVFHPELKQFLDEWATPIVT